MDVTKGNKLPAVCPDIPGDGVFILIYLASPFKTIIKIPKNKTKIEKTFYCRYYHIYSIILVYKFHCHIVENEY